MGECQCKGNTLFRSDRREFLTVGALGMLGIALGDLQRAHSAQAEEPAPPAAKAQSIIHIFLPGGIAHQECFDPKPLAPLEYRGSFGAIPTKLPGVQFCETMPKLAAEADKLTIIRSMSHGGAAHERATHNMFTGYRPTTNRTAKAITSVLSPRQTTG